MNRFEYDGKVYIAQPEIRLCRGCAFRDAEPRCSDMEPLPLCQEDTREDEREIIWVEEVKEA